MLAALPILFFAAGAAQSPLIAAARNDDLVTLRTLLQQKADPNAASPDGATALHWAAYRDDLEAANLLLRAGGKVNAANDLGATPLCTACINRSAAMVRVLLAAGANPNAALLSGETPLMAAARSGSPEVVEQLLAKDARLDARGTRGQTALMWAVAEHHPEVVKLLLAHGADVHARSEVWNEVEAVPPHGFPGYNRAIPHGGDTALLFAARGGDLESARLLVAAGANVDDCDGWGVSAVTLAAHSDFADLVAFLLDKRANPNLAQAGFTALDAAIMHRDEKMAAALVGHGADANAPLLTWTPTRRSSHDFNFAPELVGATPLWLAARFTEPGIMRLLLARGADAKFVHQGDRVANEKGGSFVHHTESTTIVMAALGMGGGAAWAELPRAGREALTLDAVKLAVEHGAEINAAALDTAKTLRYPSVVKFLTENGAK